MARKFASALSHHPLSAETLPTYGTNALAHVINEAGAYPTRNFSTGQFEGTEAISGERQHDVIVTQHPVTNLRDLRIEFQACIFRQVDRAHAALTELAEDVVTTLQNLATVE